MENIIKWQTGTPNYNGNYLITYRYFDCDPKYVMVAIREGNSWYSTTYDSLRVDVLAWYPINNIEPYKEETMEDKGTLEQIDLTKELRKANNIEVILGDYEFVLKDGKTYFVKKKPQYPKTYKECCDILGLNTMDNDAQGYKADLIIQFQELIIARDAYWKIAGEEMGLDKPWKPDWSIYKHKFCLGTDKDKVIEECVTTGNRILAFPTKEMRDVFYDAFEELINEVKELL